MEKTPLVAGMALLVLLAAAGGGYAYAVHEGQAEVAATAARIREGVGPNGSFSYESSHVSPLSGSATLERVALRAADGTLCTADSVTVAAGTAGHIRLLHADRIRVADGGGSLQANALDASDVLVPVGVPGAPARVDPAAITFADAALHGIVLGLPGSTVSVGSLQVSGYGAGRPSTASVEDAVATFGGSSRVDNFGLRAFKMTGVDISSVVDAVEHRRKPSTQAGVQAISADMIYVAKGSNHFVSIARVELSGSAESTAPSWSKALMSGISVVPTNPDIADTLRRIGLDAFRYDMAVSVSYDPVKEKIRASPISAVFQGLGTVELDFDLAQVDLSALRSAQPDIASVTSALLGIGLQDARMKVVDTGALDRVFSAKAKADDVSEDVERQDAVRRLREDDQFEASVPDDGVRSVIEEFLARGGRFEIRATPASPVNVAQLAAAAATGPGSVLSAMNVTSRWSGAADTGGGF